MTELSDNTLRLIREAAKIARENQLEVLVVGDITIKPIYGLIEMPSSGTFPTFAFGKPEMAVMDEFIHGEEVTEEDLYGSVDN